MAHRLRAVPFAAEVYSFKAEIGGDQQFMAAWRAYDGAVVPDTAYNGRTRLGGATANPLDQFSFRQGQGLSSTPHLVFCF